MESVSPITQERYPIPDPPADGNMIDRFVEANSDKEIVAIQGLGFVGAIMALVVANSFKEAYAVIGIDLPHPDSYWKVAGMNAGHFPIVSSDPKVEPFFREAQEQNRLLATADPYAFEHADVIVVDVNLDVEKTGSEEGDFQVDLAPLKEAVRTFGERCKNDVLTLIETTVPPGTCEHVLAPFLKELFQKRGFSNDPALAHSYERVMPGKNYVDSIRDFYRVFAGIDRETAERAEAFLDGIIRTDRHPLTELKSTTASEVAKVLENSYRATNIAFIQEWTEFGEEAGIDLHEVIHTIRKRPTHQNMMLPGLGVGGYCLTKDPLLASWARQHIFNASSPLSNSERAVRINDSMPLHTFHHIKRNGAALKGTKVLLLGVSYLSDIGDTRYTPVAPLYDALKEEGCELVLHDPYIYYWQEKEVAVEQDIGRCLEADPDIVVLTTAHSIYKDPSFAKDSLTLSEKIFVDAWGAIPEDGLDKLRDRNRVDVIGKGDL